MDNRLKKEKDFDKVFKSGKRFYSDSFTLYILESKDIKVGYSVGKRHGTSVVRNRIKRLLRESFRSFSLKGEYRMVFVPKVREEYSLFKYKRDMEYVFKKGGLI